MTTPFTWGTVTMGLLHSGPYKKNKKASRAYRGAFLVEKKRLLFGWSYGLMIAISVF